MRLVLFPQRHRFGDPHDAGLPGGVEPNPNRTGGDGSEAAKGLARVGGGGGGDRTRSPVGTPGNRKVTRAFGDLLASLERGGHRFRTPDQRPVLSVACSYESRST